MRRVLLLRIFLGTTFPGYLSSASLVVGIKTLVAARHMITQNLGGKRISVGQKGWQNVLIVAVANFFGFHILEQSKNYSLYRGSKANFPLKNVTLVLPSPKYRSLSFTKKSGGRMEHKLFDG